MEVGVACEQDFKLVQLSEQKSSIKKKLEDAIGKSEDPYTDDRVKKYSFHLSETEKAIDRFVNINFC